MLLADGFWELKSFVDWLAVVGLVLSLFSIWLAVWLARRDLAKRIANAEEVTIARLKRALLPPEIADAIRCVREARDACRNQRWERALDRCEEAQERLTRLCQFKGLEEGDGAALDRAVDQLKLIGQQLREVLAENNKRKELSASKRKELDELLKALAVIDGKLRFQG